MDRYYVQNKGWSQDELDTQHWKEVNINASDMSDNRKKLFEIRKKAIDLYLKTDLRLSEIEKDSGLSRQFIYILLDRCMTTHRDGDVYGYRGLIPYNRITKTPKKDSLSNIFSSFPDIKSEIDLVILGKKGIQGLPREKSISIKVIHQYFLKICSNHGIPLTDYPFNTKWKGLRGFQKYSKNLLNENINSFSDRETTYGKQKSIITKAPGDPRKKPINPLERVEFDGHKIDAYFVGNYPMPSGEIVQKEIPRPWVLTVFDVVTKCVLGYHITLNSEYNSDDVIETIVKSLKPWKRKSITIPDITYQEGDGFPNPLIAESINAKWQEFYLDNGMANKANNVKRLVIDKLHANYCLGPVANPIRRPYVERFFRRMETELIHRLPSTTGSSPSDVKRQKPIEQAIKYNIKITDLEQILDVWMANYNNSPHTGLQGRSPLQVFREHVDSGIILPKYSDNELSDLNNIEVIRKVCGNLKTGVRPYINYENVRYSSYIFRETSQYIGNIVILRINPDDLRKIRVFKRNNGEEIGILEAEGAWGYEPHNLKLRKAIWKRNDKNFQVKSFDNPINAYLKSLEKDSKSDMRIRGRLQNIAKNSKINSDNNKLKNKIITQNDIDAAPNESKKDASFEELLREEFKDFPKAFINDNGDD